VPLYEYRCSACEHQFEVIQSFSAKPLRKCEKCGGKVEKLISRAGFVLKGGGWYKSDYAPSKPSAKESSGESGSEGAKPESGSKEAPAAPAATSSEPAAKPAEPSAKKPKAAKR
jgi:putative FmdB family regulatory protein